MKHPSVMLVGLLVAWAMGCVVGPEYRRPTPLDRAELPASLGSPETNRVGETSGEWKVAEPGKAEAGAAWWSVFGDPVLDRLEAMAGEVNPSLAAAGARLEQARAVTDVVRAARFPQAKAGGAATRKRTSENEPQQGRAAGDSRTFEVFQVPLDASWEVDLWGRVRRQSEAARARTEASADDLEGVRLSVQAEVAADYFGWRAVRSEIAALEATLAAFARSAELVKNRRAGGVASDLEVAQAETQLRTAEALLPVRRLEAERLRHALAALCGAAPAGWTMPGSAGSDGAMPVRAPPAVPEVVPSEWLERRPDVAAAERRMAAANAEVGVARAAFYPRVRIDARAGFESVDAGTLFDWPSRLWSVGPVLDVPVFTAGRNRAQLKWSKAAYDEAVAHYREVVLSAFQEVADRLAAQHWLSRQLEAERAALSAARRTLELANNRYRSGLVTFLEVATAQGVVFQRESTVVRLEGDRLILATRLIKAMGGGWKATPVSGG